MLRVLCTTNTCTLQRAQLCHAAQTIATLHAQVAALTAERDGLALQLAQARRDVAQAVAALRERKPVMVCEGDADTVRALLAAMERMTQ